MSTTSETLDLHPNATAHTILVVEPEVLARLVIADYLRDCGYKVFEAASSDEAVAMLQAPDVAVDIVFSDVQMPGDMDGFGLARWIRAHLRACVSS